MCIWLQALAGGLLQPLRSGVADNFYLTHAQLRNCTTAQLKTRNFLDQQFKLALVDSVDRRWARQQPSRCLQWIMALLKVEDL